MRERKNERDKRVTKERCIGVREKKVSKRERGERE